MFQRFAILFKKIISPTKPLINGLSLKGEKITVGIGVFTNHKA